MTDCEHEWERGHLTDGRPIESCTKCPRWKLSIWARSFGKDPERGRRAMEETSRRLGEHHDV